MLKKTITQLSIIAIVIGSVFLANGLILAWSPPSSSPPGGNVPAPLNVGPTGQSKAGGLILNTGGAAVGLLVDQGNVGIGIAPGEKLDVAGYVKGRTGLCIGDDCRTIWPSGGDGHDQSNCYWRAVGSGWGVPAPFNCADGYYVAGVQNQYNLLAWDFQITHLYCCQF